MKHTKKHQIIVGLMLVRGDDWSMEFAGHAWCSAVDAWVVCVDHRPGEGNPFTTTRFSDLAEASNDIGVRSPNRGCGEIIERRLGPFDRKPIRVICTNTDIFDEMQVRQAMLDTARSAFNATHYVIADADEAPSFERCRTIRADITDLEPGQSLRCRMISPWNGLTHRRIDGNFNSAHVTVAFADAPELHWRNADDGYRYHNRTPRGIAKVITIDEPSLIHLQYASIRRLQVKSVWYKLIERTAHGMRDTAAALNEKYDWVFNSGTPNIVPMECKYLGGYESWLDLIKLSDKPWQEEEFFRLLPTMSTEQLRGLNFHGLAPNIE